MAKILRPVTNPNITDFTFQGYVTKLIQTKKDGVVEKTIAIEVSTGPSKVGSVRLSLSRFHGDVNTLVVGTPYMFYVSVVTGYDTRLDYKNLTRVEKLDTEPVKGIRTRLIGKIKQSFCSIVDSLHVIDFAVTPYEGARYDEVYRCRYKLTDASILKKFKEDTYWLADVEFKQTAWLLSWYDERENCYHVNEELETYWVTERDDKGNVITVSDGIGGQKPKLKKITSKTFIEVLWINLIDQVEYNPSSGDEDDDE